MLVDIQYERNDVDFHRGTFRVRGDVVEVFPAYEQETAIRIEFFGDEIEAIREVDPLRGKVKGDARALRDLPRLALRHAAGADAHARSTAIREELRERLDFFDKAGRFLEKQRLEQRTLYDLEMMEQMGFCNGIENYSRHLSGRKAGEPPPTLIDYFPQGLPARSSTSRTRRCRRSARCTAAIARARRRSSSTASACRARSTTGRSSSKSSRSTSSTCIYVSATPGDYELEKAQGVVVEQVIRPTGLMDPPIEVRPVGGPGRRSARRDPRARRRRTSACSCTTLTKRMAEDLTDYYRELGVRVRYLHSDVDTLERIDILRDLRRGEFDVLVGINLLREGLDLPEVSLVAILDADKEGFLRSPRSLIQTIGRAARNVNGRVIMYADRDHRRR